MKKGMPPQSETNSLSSNENHLNNFNELLMLGSVPVTARLGRRRGGSDKKERDA
jgi:hypothetical protein